MKTRIKMMVSSALVGFGLAVLVLPLCLSGMRMLAVVNSAEVTCSSGQCQKVTRGDDVPKFDCVNETCTAQGGPCRCLPIYVSNSCSCVNYPWIPEQKGK